jgi:hypothetical protein
VQHGSRRGLLQRQPEEVRGIEPVHGRPAAGAVAEVAGDALVAGDADQGRHEAAISIAVHRRREPQDGRADAARGEGERQQRGALPGPRAAARPRGNRVGIPPVLFGRHPARGEPGQPRSEHEGPVTAGECLAECLDGAAVGVGGAREIPGESDVVLEREVDHAVRPGRPGAKAVEVVEGAAVHRCARGRERRGRGVGASEAEDLVPRADELGHDGGADPAGRAGHENMHEKTPRGLAIPAPGLCGDALCQLLSSQ